MALIEKYVNVTTKHARMHTFAACPDASGPFPAIILYMDAPGYREELEHQARRIAKHGYFWVLPDLYYRYGTLRFDTPRRGEQMSNVIKAAYTSLTNADIVDDTSGLLVRMVRHGRSPIGRVPTQVDFSDYRDVTGVKFPFHWTFAWLDGRDSFEFSDVKFNVPIDAAKFGEPRVPAAAPR